VQVIVIPIAEATAVYIGLAVLMGLLGRRRKLGAWGYFFASILLTPVIGLLLVLASDRRQRVRKRDLRRLAALEQKEPSRDGLAGPSSSRR
jgi:hypothetical protein